jgi:four helix bundle protein
MEAAMTVYEISKGFPPYERFSLTDQVRRPSRSTPAQISEAWRRRRYAAAFVNKLNEAEGEAAESQTHIELARRCNYLSDAQAAKLDSIYEEILAMLVKMAHQPEKWCL